MKWRPGEDEELFISRKWWCLDQMREIFPHLLTSCSRSPASWVRLEALQLSGVPDGISVTRLEGVWGPCGQPQLAATPPNWHCGHQGSEGLSEGSTCSRRARMQETHALCSVTYSCPGGIPAYVRQLPSLLSESRSWPKKSLTSRAEETVWL